MSDILTMDVKLQQCCCKRTASHISRRLWGPPLTAFQPMTPTPNNTKSTTKVSFLDHWQVWGEKRVLSECCLVQFHWWSATHCLDSTRSKDHFAVPMNIFCLIRWRSFQWSLFEDTFIDMASLCILMCRPWSHANNLSAKWSYNWTVIPYVWIILLIS